MNHSTKKPTKAEERWLQDIKEMGCIVCLTESKESRPAEAHHILSGGKRLGHCHTIPLCAWHHRGDASKFGDPAFARKLIGPSMAEEKNAFVERFGSELYLLRLTTFVLKHWRRLQDQDRAA